VREREKQRDCVSERVCLRERKRGRGKRENRKQKEKETEKEGMYKIKNLTGNKEKKRQRIRNNQENQTCSGQTKY